MSDFARQLTRTKPRSTTAIAVLAWWAVLLWWGVSPGTGQRDEDWQAWCAEYMVREQRGEEQSADIVSPSSSAKQVAQCAEVAAAGAAGATRRMRGTSRVAITKASMIVWNASAKARVEASR